MILFALLALTAASFSLARWSMEKMTGNVFPPLVEMKMKEHELEIKVNGKWYMMDCQWLMDLARQALDPDRFIDGKPDAR